MELLCPLDTPLSLSLPSFFLKVFVEEGKNKLHNEKIITNVTNLIQHSLSPHAFFPTLCLFGFFLFVSNVRARYKASDEAWMNQIFPSSFLVTKKHGLSTIVVRNFTIVAFFLIVLRLYYNRRQPVKKNLVFFFFFFVTPTILDTSVSEVRN